LVSTSGEGFGLVVCFSIVWVWVWFGLVSGKWNVVMEKHWGKHTGVAAITVLTIVVVTVAGVALARKHEHAVLIRAFCARPFAEGQAAAI